jgi:glycosyltransferase involved in cell wall biosynthesis
MTGLAPCTYVTHGWGVHDERWTQALADLGFTVETISLTRDGLDITDVNSRLAQGSGPVLAGPLDSITSRIRTSRPVIGLSWGFDLLEMRARSEDITWLTGLKGLVVDSPETRAIAQAAGVHDDRIRTIPWGIDLDTCTDTETAQTPASFALPSTTRLIVTLRAHEARYRNDDILTAFCDLGLEDCALILGNSGSLTADLSRRAQSSPLADRIRFVGTLPESDIPSLLHGADVYVTASEVDGTSVTLLQAMACGVPVVASDTPGNRAWVTPGETGWLFRTGDATDLRRALRDALTADPVATRRMAEAARDRVVRDADWRANRTRLLALMAPGANT